ncbi:MAG: D-erythronate dehydrogenase [Cypionkella sp.]|uniref:D-erythronate dehydrogenase n=1 Tax=Cypionkella sp. TaxID=2811411 RepID=UPI002ABA402B|nr:D-erythronate dehydrogenase [Cypionkella sp.]MDZ4311717.1 D-erythronate dehydrogenase [Cypionkella sp.]
MRVLITGAAGMIGRKLAAALLARGALQGQQISQLILHDIVAAEVEAPHIALEGDLSGPGVAAGLIAHRPEVIFHLAGVVSGEAEANFDLGYRVNVDGTRALFEAIRAAGYAPRVVYASTTAVFGGPFPEEIPDDFAPTPHSSYGVQKLIGEALLSDYARRGFFDGIGLRLPTICVRPGKANRAASSFFSGIIREPLNGLPADLPVARDWLHTMASPRAAVGFFLHAAELDLAAVGPRRNLTLPGVAVTVGEQIEALTRAAGAEVAGLIRDVPDPAVWAIVQSWPRRFAATRARALGFQAEESFDQILQAYVEEDLHRV